MGVPLYGFIVIIKPSGGDGKVYPLTETRVTIGRQDTCNIRIPNLKVSKEHCAIRVVGRKVTLTNLSSNKTIVGGQFLALGQQRVLRYGDIITIAGRSLRYEKPTMSYTETATPPGTRIDIGSLPQTPQTEPVPRQHRRADGPESASPTTPTVRAKPMPLSEGRTQQRARLVRCALRAADIKAKIDRWNLFYSESDDQPRKPSGPRSRQGADAVGSEADLTEESPPADLFDDLGEGTSRKRSVPSTPHDDGDGDERRADEAAQIIKGSNVGSRRPQLTTPVSGRKRARLLENGTAQSEGKESAACLLQRRTSVPQFMDGLKNSRDPGVDVHPVMLSQPQELITPAQSSSSASTLPMKSTASAYGSEDKTSRVTIGANAESAFTKSPTLQRKRMTMQLRSQRKEQEKDKALDPVDAATKLVSVSGEKQQPQAEMHRRSAMPSMTSPLKRTWSSGGPFAAARRLCPESLSYLPPCTGPMAVSNGQTTEGDSSDEVPTEPEPESESEDEQPAPVAASNGRASQGLLTRKRHHLTDDEGTPPRKSVRFGPPLSPELFDTHEPPATPLRRGTPMQMAPGAASILRQTPEFVQISTPHPGVFGSHVLLRGSPGAYTGNTSLIGSFAQFATVNSAGFSGYR
ncbi:hypothetical protein DL89DRAFT_172086 [Linderina pennispora]|uniref:FHA domain-containing protein n=1 Tax=Linderina pennispora TaxID=61395 RepID=A0A1Y1W6I1_9FUNG|nr:uncharacterized protein DL89DRAFT_172086 [Linderina pennispora]ORX69150.1 hypothetical protein DL89DRAFT_172086 [Linderina pennispora]